MYKAKFILLSILIVPMFVAADTANSTQAGQQTVGQRIKKALLEFSKKDSGELKYGTFSSDAGRYYYELGGTDLTPPSFGSFANNSTNLIGFQASGGISYSCGNLSATYRNSLRQLGQTIRSLPSNLRNMAEQMLQAGMAALPMYVLNEANPVLAQVFSNSMFTLDENFRMSVKSCEQLESSILAGNGMGDWVTFNISKGMQNQLKTLKSGNSDLTVEDFVTKSQNNASCSNSNKRGVEWLEGGYYGGHNKPLYIEEHTVIAGYNASRNFKYKNSGTNTQLLSATNNPAPTNQVPTNPPAPKTQIMRQWETPQAAADFVTSTIGKTKITLCNGDVAQVTVARAPGRTLKAHYDNYNKKFKELLVNIIDETQTVSEAQYKSLGNLELSTKVIEIIRRQKQDTKLLTISKLASSFAYEKTRKLALDAINLMRIGSQTQYIASATPAKQYIDEAIKRLNDDVSDLKQSAEPNTAADIILKILNN